MDDSHVDRFSNILPSDSYGSPAVSDPCLPILDFLVSCWFAALPPLRNVDIPPYPLAMVYRTAALC